MITQYFFDQKENLIHEQNAPKNKTANNCKERIC